MIYNKILASNDTEIMARYMDAYESRGIEAPMGYVWSFCGGCDYELISIEQQNAEYDRWFNCSPSPREHYKLTLSTETKQKRNRKAKERKKLRKMYS